MGLNKAQRALFRELADHIEKHIVTCKENGWTEDARELRNYLRNLREWLDGRRDGSCPIQIGDLERLHVPQARTIWVQIYPPAKGVVEEPGTQLDEKETTGLPIFQISATEPEVEPEPEDESILTPSTPVTGPVEEITPPPVPDTRDETEIPAQTEPPVQEEDTPSIPVDTFPLGEGDHREGADQLAQKMVSREMENVREMVRNGQYQEALSLGNSLLARFPNEIGAIREELDPQLDTARKKLNERLEEVLRNGDEARAAGDREKARKQYQEARQIDPENQHAIKALRELDAGLEGELPEATLRELRVGLGERRDVEKLGEVIYRAEALVQEGLLPQELKKKLTEARTYFEETRKAMGQDTTQMRFGDLQGRVDAVKKIRERVAAGRETVIWDETTNTYLPITEALAEAERHLEEGSADTAEYELGRIAALLPAFPTGARARLDKALTQPFSEKHRRILEAKRSEIEALEKREREALQLLSRAEQATDSVEAFSLVLQASGVFSYLEGLGGPNGKSCTRIDQARDTALVELVSTIQGALNQAELERKHGQYNEARDRIGKAQKELARWPEKPIHPQLEELSQKLKELGERVTQTESNWLELQKYIGQIRAQVLQPSTRAAGLALFRQVHANPRYQEFTDLSVFQSEIDQYQSIDENLNALDNAYYDHNWQRVLELATVILESKKAGNFTSQVEIQRWEARLALAVSKIRQHIEDIDIAKANQVLSKTKSDLQTDINKAGGETKQRLQKLLEEFLKETSPEAKKIQECIEHTPQFQKLYMEAQELANKPGAKEQMTALAIFRYIAGETDQGQAGWPDYHESLRTADARQERRALEDKLRPALLAPIQQARTRQESDLTEEEIRQLAENARGLREVGLLQSESERAAVQWIEVKWGILRASSLEKTGDWDEAVKIWEELDRYHPGTPIVEKRLRHARIRQLIAKVEKWLVQGKPEEALEELQAAQDNVIFSRSWEVSRLLARTHSALGNFEDAFRALEDAEKNLTRDYTDRPASEYEQQLASLESTRKELEQEQYVRGILTRVGEAWTGEERGALEALRILREALENPLGKDERRLVNKRDVILHSAEQAILRNVEELENEQGDEGKLKVIEILLDLTSLEEQAGISQEKSRAWEELDQRKASLGPQIRQIMQQLKHLDDFNQMPLKDAIREAEALKARAEASEKAAQAFQRDIENKDAFSQATQKLVDRLRQLKQADELLASASSEDFWNIAIQTGNFDQLDQLLNQIRALDVAGFIEVTAYEEKLEEYKEIRKTLQKVNDDLRHQFGTMENFNAVIETIRLYRTLPFRGNGKTWKYLDQAQYETVLRIMSNRLSIPNIYCYEDNDPQQIRGWDELEKIAGDRDQELKKFEEWRKICKGGKDQLDHLWTEIQENGEALGLRVQIRDWQELLDGGNELRRMISAGPYGDSEPFNVHSKKAQTIQEEVKKIGEVIGSYLVAAEEKLKDLRKTVENEGGFPTQEQWRQAAGSMNQQYMEKLIARAIRMGALTPEESKEIEVYQNVLNGWKNPEPWWRILFRRLFR